MLSVLAALLFSSSAFAMPQSSYDSLVRQVDGESFSDDQLTVLRTAASANTFSPRQAAGLLNEFSFSRRCAFWHRDSKLETTASSSLRSRFRPTKRKRKESWHRLAPRRNPRRNRSHSPCLPPSHSRLLKAVAADSISTLAAWVSASTTVDGPHPRPVLRPASQTRHPPVRPPHKPRPSAQVPRPSAQVP
jgi:hypothetical protein